MESVPAQSWFVRWALAVALALVAVATAAAVGPPAPLLPIGRTGPIATLDRYMSARVPDIVLVGSSLTARLKEEYFDAPNLKVLGIAGGSPVTALEVVLARDQLPKIVLIEMNVLERGEDLELVQKIKDGGSLATLPRPIRSAVAFYERWLHAPPDPSEARDIVTALLRAPPSDFDNRVYVERAMREHSVPPSLADTMKNVATLERLVKQIEERGSLVYFYSLPYAEPLQDSVYAKATANTAHATFTNDLQWLRLELPMHELRWADGAHLDERSSIVVAKELQKQLLSRAPSRPPTRDNSARVRIP
jgi:hypothetical protein